jgi:hypothetical protein
LQHHPLNLKAKPWESTGQTSGLPVRELFANDASIIKDPRFQNAKSISSRIAETYRSFGIEALGSGISYGKSAGIVTQPVIVPSPTLANHIEDLVVLIREHGYKNGILLQTRCRLKINPAYLRPHSGNE